MIDEACSIILNAVSAILFCLLSKHGLISTISKQQVLLSIKRLLIKPATSSSVNPLGTGVPVPYDIRSQSKLSTSNDI